MSPGHMTLKSCGSKVDAVFKVRHSSCPSADLMTVFLYCTPAVCIESHFIWSQKQACLVKRKKICLRLAVSGQFNPKSENCDLQSSDIMSVVHLTCKFQVEEVFYLFFVGVWEMQVVTSTQSSTNAAFMTTGNLEFSKLELSHLLLTFSHRVFTRIRPAEVVNIINSLRYFNLSTNMGIRDLFWLVVNFFLKGMW